MTASDACTILADTVRELATARAEAHRYRLVAVAGIHHGHDLHVENQRLRRQLEHLREELRRQRAESIAGNRLQRAA